MPDGAMNWYTDIRKKKVQAILRRIAKEFEPDRQYSEKQTNEIADCG